MKTKWLLPIVTGIILLGVSAQKGFSQTDSILIESGLSGNNYFFHNQKLKSVQVLDMLEPNPDAYDLFNSGQEAFTFANIFGVTGIGLIITSSILSMTNDESNWSMAWAGAGIILVSVPLYHKYNKTTSAAINMYNGLLPESQPKPEDNTQLNFGITNNGIGFCLKF